MGSLSWNLPRERGKCTAVNVTVPQKKTKKPKKNKKKHSTQPSSLFVDKDFQGRILSLEVSSQKKICPAAVLV